VPSVDVVRNLTLDLRGRLGNDTGTVVALIGIVNSKPVVVVATNELARNSKVQAGNIVRHVSKILGGGGGGKPDLAQGGGQDVLKIDKALNGVIECI
jgi:alanyl-tRNA synthetase